jgi:hypothetical protein
VAGARTYKGIRWCDPCHALTFNATRFYADEPPATIVIACLDCGTVTTHPHDIPGVRFFGHANEPRRDGGDGPEGDAPMRKSATERKRRRITGIDPWPDFL